MLSVELRVDWVQYVIKDTSNKPLNIISEQFSALWNVKYIWHKNNGPSLLTKNRFYALAFESAPHIMLPTKAKSRARKLIFEHSIVQYVVITV